MGKFKRLHSCIPPEKIELRKRYAISLNPSFDIKCFDNAIKQLNVVLNKTNAIDEIVLYPELSPIGKLHYHGVIVINDVFLFYFEDLKLLKDFGSFEIDTIADPKYWIDEYCRKGESYMKPKVLSIKNATYPLVFRGVDAIMQKKQKQIEWAKHMEEQCAKIETLHYKKFDLDEDNQENE